MKAPDKIFYKELNNKQIYISKFPNYDLHGVEGEYIRKDALLEWAEEQTTFESDGYVRAMLALIDKLNSL